MGLARGPRSELDTSHVVKPQQAQALPRIGALHRGCLQGDLQAREMMRTRLGR